MSDDYVVDPDAGTSGTAGYVDPKVEDCPLVPLGFSKGVVWLALPEGEVREVRADRIAAMLRTDLYASIEGAMFLGNWRDADGKLDLISAGRWLVRKCRERGYWDVSRPQRGYGVWPSDAGPVVHAGDAIGGWPFAEGDWRSVSDALREETQGPLWLVRPRAPRPSKPASAKTVKAMRDGLDAWRFAPLGDKGLTEADVLFGFIGVALLGAVPRFRPVLSMVGGAGTGKTTLSRYVQAMASANAGALLDSFTDAGLRQSLAGEARALFLDEAEPSPDGQPGPVEKAMEVLRRMATGEGSAGRQGSITGSAASTSAVGSAYLASIFPLAPGDAMASRMVELRLKPLGQAKGESDAQLEEMIEAARAVSPELLARAVRDAGRFRADVAMLKTALGETGQSQRGADLFAALAAGRRLLMFDKALTLDDACDEVKAWASMIRARDTSASVQNPGQGCLSRIWAINSGQHIGGRFLTIGEMVQEELDGPGAHDKVLKAWGLKVENGYGQADRIGPWLVISNNHPALAKALAGTQYANWRGVLEHLVDLGEEHAPRPTAAAVRFGIHQSRALAVPLTPWLSKPVVVGANPRERSAFEDPDWDSRFGAASRDSSRPAPHEESHD